MTSTIAIPRAVAAALLLLALPAIAGDPQHDFDFAVGTWKSHIRRLKKPLSGSTEWYEVEGTVSVRKLLNGRAQLEEIEADTPDGHLQGLALRLYRPQAKEWSLHWASSKQGVFSENPATGGFSNGRGEFYDQEVFDGRMIVLREIFFDITQTSYKFEQAFSADGGKTWEPNWVAQLTRTSPEPAAPAVTAKDRNADFDWNLGRFKTHVSRIMEPLTGSTKWVEFDGTSVVTPIWGGRGNVIELDIEGPAGHTVGLGVRLYNPQSHQWNLNWANSRDGVMAIPMMGEFRNGRGDFADVELFGGRTIFVRNVFSDLKRDSARFEQAFSTDAGKTWESNWIMTWTREKQARAAPVGSGERTAP
jgi:hypothetical protein